MELLIVGVSGASFDWVVFVVPRDTQPQLNVRALHRSYPWTTSIRSMGNENVIWHYIGIRFLLTRRLVIDILTIQYTCYLQPCYRSLSQLQLSHGGSVIVDPLYQGPKSWGSLPTSWMNSFKHLLYVPVSANVFETLPAMDL